MFHYSSCTFQSHIILLAPFSRTGQFRRKTFKLLLPLSIEIDGSVSIYGEKIGVMNESLATKEESGSIRALVVKAI